MSKIVIADCGSTKIHWVVVEKGECLCEFFTTGVNPAVMDRGVIAGIFSRELPGKMPPDVAALEFYGAGCKGFDACDAIRRAVAPYIATGAAVTVESDMLGACRAISPGKASVVCILGTGANSCLYDGDRIVANVSPGGYILGDEGSGAWIGRRFASDFIKGLLPERVCSRFRDEYGVDASAIVRRVYRPQPGETPPNRFLASFAPFLSANIEEPCLREIVAEGFRQFFARNVSAYFHKEGDRCRDVATGALAVNFAGSVAHAFEPLLREVAAAGGYNVDVIVKNPMEALLRRVAGDKR